jgi:hypothetical protein
MSNVEHSKRPQIDAFEAGVVLGLLIGEGHFGGDAKQPQVTLKMHVRHEPLLNWIHARFPYARLYGPYNHDGRHYFQLMWRGTQLKYGLMPWLEATRWAEIDPHSFGRYQRMKERHGLQDVPTYARPDFEGSLLPAWDANPKPAHDSWESSAMDDG